MGQKSSSTHAASPSEQTASGNADNLDFAYLATTGSVFVAGKEIIELDGSTLAEEAEADGAMRMKMKYENESARIVSLGRCNERNDLRFAVSEYTDTQSDPSVVSIVNWSTKSVECVCSGHSGWVCGLVSVQNETRVVGGCCQTLLVHDPNRGKVVSDLSRLVESTYGSRLDSCSRIRSYPDWNSNVVYVSSTSPIQEIDLSEETEVRQFTGTTSGARDLSRSAEHNCLVSYNFINPMQIIGFWDRRSGNCEKDVRLKVKEDYGYSSLCVGNQLFVGGDKNVRCFDLRKMIDSRRVPKPMCVAGGFCGRIRDFCEVPSASPSASASVAALSWYTNSINVQLFDCHCKVRAQKCVRPGPVSLCCVVPDN